MTSLTLPGDPLVDFFPNGILEGFCFLLLSKVQSYLTVLQSKNELGYTPSKAGLANTS